MCCASGPQHLLSIKCGATSSLHLFALPSGHTLAAHQRCRTPEQPDQFEPSLSLQCVSSV